MELSTFSIITSILLAQVVMSIMGDNLNTKLRCHCQCNRDPRALPKDLDLFICSSSPPSTTRNQQMQTDLNSINARLLAHVFTVTYFPLRPICFIKRVAPNALDIEAISNKVSLVTGLLVTISATPYPLAMRIFPSLITPIDIPGVRGRCANTYKGECLQYPIENKFSNVAFFVYLFIQSGAFCTSNLFSVSYYFRNKF